MSRLSHARSAICTRNLDMTHSLFSSDVCKAILHVKQSVLLSNYRNTRGSLGELEKAVQTFALWAFDPTTFSKYCLHSRFSFSIETRFMLDRILGHQYYVSKNSFLICLSPADAERSRTELHDGN